MTRPSAASGVAFALVVLSAACAGVSAQAEPSPSRGERLFKQRCASCHQVIPGARSIMAPNLANVVDRKPGADPTYRYSPAIKKLERPWTAEALSDFLAAPGKFAPGTRMMISVPDKHDRHEIIEFLAKAGS
ncbi:cytochrome c family protein [Phenylobacterium sp.]|uniref:c-type cytochrome n=1 Tax=Phenylobacterium sp. TaxID=1871053 RepID=UPI0035B1C7FD